MLGNVRVISFPYVLWKLLASLMFNNYVYYLFWLYHWLSHCRTMMDNMCTQKVKYNCYK